MAANRLLPILWGASAFAFFMAALNVVWIIRILRRKKRNAGVPGLHTDQGEKRG